MWELAQVVKYTLLVLLAEERVKHIEETIKVTRVAFILVETTSGNARKTADLMEHADGIKAVHLVSESYGVIALVEASDSDGIREIASGIALTPGVVKCVVCSERELADLDEVNRFVEMVDDNNSCWCVKEPSWGNQHSLCLDTDWKLAEAGSKSDDRGG